LKNGSISNIQNAIKEALIMPPAAKDPALAAIRKSRLGTPVLVVDEAYQPAYWIVPIICDTKVCGFGRVDLAGKVIQLGTMGSGSLDSTSWFEESYFAEPPETTLIDIKAKFKNSTLSDPVLSFDRTPAKWGWRVEIFVGDTLERLAFIGPWGWYDRAVINNRDDLDG
jgi:hypothetical protein